MTNGPHSPHFDIDRDRGTQGELFVSDVKTALINGRIEVKAPKLFLQMGSPYVETWCLMRNGWKTSGINISTSELWFLTFGALPGGPVIETRWLHRATHLAYVKNRRREERDGSHPTKGATPTFDDFWETRPFNPDGSPR